MAYLNYENNKGSGKKLRVHFDIPEDEDYPDSAQRISTSSGSSSDSSSLESDDTYKKSHNSIDNNELNDDDNNNGCDSPIWRIPSSSVTQSPPIQVMSSIGTYDPNRIPSSVFAKSSSPVEWSLASNESLFSIHLGNNSFSRDLSFAFNKSGELPMTSDFRGMPIALPPAQEANHDEHVEKRHSVSSDSSEEDGDMNDAETSEQVETSKEAVVPREEAKNYASNSSYRSMASDISVRSFQFPLLTGDGGASARNSSASGARNSTSTVGRTSSSTVQSEKQLRKTESHHYDDNHLEKSESHDHEENQTESHDHDQEENPHNPTTPKADETEPKKGGKSWYCCCFSWSPCF